MLGKKNEKRLGFNIRGGVERGTWATCCTFDGAWGPSATKKIIAAKPKGQRKNERVRVQTTILTG